MLHLTVETLLLPARNRADLPPLLPHGSMSGCPQGPDPEAPPPFEFTLFSALGSQPCFQPWGVGGRRNPIAAAREVFAGFNGGSGSWGPAKSLCCVWEKGLCLRWDVFVNPLSQVDPLELFPFRSPTSSTSVFWGSFPPPVQSPPISCFPEGWWGRVPCAKLLRRGGCKEPAPFSPLPAG